MLPEDWGSSGLQTFQRLFRFKRLNAQSRVIDYGCGTLRVGHHFVDYLDKGGFTGLDVIDGFIKLGEEKIAGEKLKGKAPVLSSIGPLSISQAEAFSADFVYSTGVTMYVHADDEDEYFGNLCR